MDTGQLWQRCRSGDGEARGLLIEQYAPLATSVARRMRVPTGALLGPDDLASAGFLGLIDAVDRFEPDREVAFEAYASLRIRGASSMSCGASTTAAAPSAAGCVRRSAPTGSPRSPDTRTRCLST